MIDPLIICTCFCYWSWKIGREWFKQYLDVSTTLSPYYRKAEPAFIGEMCQLRKLTLRQARRLLANLQFMATIEADYCLTCLCLLAWADGTIFGLNSHEYIIHWQGLPKIVDEGIYPTQWLGSRPMGRLLLVEDLMLSTPPTKTLDGGHYVIDQIVYWVRKFWGIFYSDYTRFEAYEESK